MNNEEIIEGNKLIAEFMGYKEGFPHEGGDYINCSDVVEGYEIPDHERAFPHNDDKDSHQFPLNYLEFHSSWDWLVPVVKKILDLNNMSELYKRMTRVTESLIYLDIQILFEEVVKFIKWYNSQQTSKQ